MISKPILKILLFSLQLPGLLFTSWPEEDLFSQFLKNTVNSTKHIDFLDTIFIQRPYLWSIAFTISKPNGILTLNIYGLCTLIDSIHRFLKTLFIPTILLILNLKRDLLILNLFLETMKDLGLTLRQKKKMKNENNFFSLLNFRN